MSKEGIAFEGSPFLRASTLRLCRRYLFSMAMAASSSLITRGFRTWGGSLKLTSSDGRFFRSRSRSMPTFTKSAEDGSFQRLNMPKT
jgi:hypothetical protein